MGTDQLALGRGAAGCPGFTSQRDTARPEAKQTHLLHPRLSSLDIQISCCLTGIAGS